MIKVISNIIENKKLNNFQKCIDAIEFPFYLRSTPVINSKNNDFVLEHCLIKRKEDRNDKNENILNSDWAKDFIGIFEDFCTKQKIKNTEIYRASVNLTFSNGYKRCAVHQDHPYKHRQLIIYLNNADPISTTVILNNKNKILKEIIPKKNKGVFFNSNPHYHNYPKKGYRLSLVYTFK
jgi:hypothetical protein|tara:strand:+ start:1098 stop:1634 length:537 start_codon:yes stop_codon:yes gene_type:complete